MKLTRKQIRKNRTWAHFLWWLNLEQHPVFHRDLSPWPDYDPNQFRDAFEQFQTHGSGKLSPQQKEGIGPLISAQAQKEILLNSLAIESLEYKARGWGWLQPWRHTIETSKTDKRPFDRLTLVAILRTIKSIKLQGIDFFERHPGIPANLKQRYFDQIANL